MENGHGMLHHLQTNTNSWNQNELVAAVENGKVTTFAPSSTKPTNILLLEPGQTFTGEIVDIRNGSVTISVGEEFVKAQFQQSMNVCIGEVMTFVVRENQNQKITIAPLQQQMNAEDIALYKALDAADLPATDKNIDLVSELLNNQMAVDKKSIQFLLAKSFQLPEASISDLVLLQKYKIPITKENVEQLQQYRTNQSNLANDIKELAYALPDFMKQAMDSNESESGIHLLKMIFKEEGNSFSAIEQENDGINKIKHILSELDGIDEIDKEDIVQKRYASLRNQIVDLLEHSDTKESISKYLLEKLSIHPKELNQKTLQETYDKIEKHLEMMKEAMGTETWTGISKVQNNLEFIRNVNESFLYTQLPLKMQQEILNGELYVFTNKKAKLSAKDGIHLVLRLNMEYLGDMEIAVNLLNQHLNLDFSLEKQETIQLVQSHIEELNDVLKEKGFAVQTKIVEESKKEPLNLVKDVMESEESRKRKKSLTFDMRA